MAFDRVHQFGCVLICTRLKPEHAYKKEVHSHEEKATVRKQPGIYCIFGTNPNIAQDAEVWNCVKGCDVSRYTVVPDL